MKKLCEKLNQRTSKDEMDLTIMFIKGVSKFVKNLGNRLYSILISNCFKLN